jgi:biotin carboxyl carrier protein
MKMILKKILFYVAVLILFSCFSCNRSNEIKETESEPKTPVTITSAIQEPLAETIEMNATSAFQVKDNVKAMLNGYIQEVHIKLGDYVKKGQLLFTLKTKEASALSTKTNDTTFNFSGLIKIYAPLSGVITTLGKQNGDYVQDGDDLTVIAEQSSLVFILEIPFESKKFVKLGSFCNITLPDGEMVKGVVNSEMPTVDEESQTQKFVLKPQASSMLPENLIVNVEIVKSKKPVAQTLPKDAVLTNETQTEWWVMKLINDSVAIKVSVKKGIESSEKIEIIEPVFSSSDRIIISGDYGLADTAKVNIIKQNVK